MARSAIRGDWTGTAVFVPLALRSMRATKYHSSPPHLLRQLHHHPQLRPLLLLAEHVAFLGRGEAALRREAELINRHVATGVLDAALDDVLLLHGTGLGGDQAEHEGFVLGQEAQRLEAACALAVPFEKIAVDVHSVEQEIGNRLVAA